MLLVPHTPLLPVRGSGELSNTQQSSNNILHYPEACWPHLLLSPVDQTEVRMRRRHQEIYLYVPVLGDLQVIFEGDDVIRNVVHPVHGRRAQV